MVQLELIYALGNHHHYQSALLVGMLWTILLHTLESVIALKFALNSRIPQNHLQFVEQQLLIDVKSRHQLERKIHRTKPVFCVSPSWLSFLLLFFLSQILNLKEWMAFHCFLKCFSTSVLTLLEKQICIPPKKAVLST